MIKKFLENRVLGRFFKISLTTNEEMMARDAVEQKYKTAISQSFLFSLLMTPSLLLLNTEIVVSVLIPTTMVAGTAWFSVSLASMKKKFEDFGMELTRDLFVAFALSLMMLFMATAFSLTEELWRPLITPYENVKLLKLISALLALVVVGKLLWSIFSGSLKYDINDAMLTGQNEAAERFFKKSISLLNNASEELKGNRNLSVANYTMGVAFFEIFNKIEELVANESSFKSEGLVSSANELIRRPEMDQSEADQIAQSLVTSFMTIINESVNDNELKADIKGNKSYQAIEFELDCLKTNTEEQEIVDIRMSVIFSEIMDLIEEFGPQLFGE